MSLLALTRRGVLASEWTKLRSVRSTYLTMLAAAVGALLIGFLVTHSDVTSWPHKPLSERARFDPVSDSLIGFAIVQLAFGVLGVLGISSEYGTGMSRTTFAAVPRRRTVLVAKIAVVGGLTLAVGEALVFVTFFLGRLVLSARHQDVSLGDPHVLRAVTPGPCSRTPTGTLRPVPVGVPRLRSGVLQEARRAARRGSQTARPMMAIARGTWTGVRESWPASRIRPPM